MYEKKTLFSVYFTLHVYSGFKSDIYFVSSFFLFSDPTEIIKRPSNQGVRVGGVASFFCAARGNYCVINFKAKIKFRMFMKRN